MKGNIETIDHQNNFLSTSEDIFDKRYYSINKIFLRLIGQWPYDSDREKRIRLSIVLLSSFSSFIPQMLSMVTSWRTLDTFVACFTPLWTNIGCILVLSNFKCYLDNMKKILDETRSNWEVMRDLPQIKILQEHGEKGRFFTIMYSVVVYIGVFGWILTPLVPKVMDVIVPLNSSRPRLDMIPTDYRVDPDKYFWHIYFHLSISIVIVLSVIVAIDSIYLSLSQHVCGMFDILRYDLENLVQEGNNQIILNPEYNLDIYYHHIVSYIKRHKILVKYVDSIQSTCGWVLILVIGMSVVALTLTGYLTVAESTPKQDVVRMGLFTIAQAYHLFVITLPGHWITESSSFVPDSIYGSKWYMMSLRSRKLLVLFIRATTQPCYITTAKIYVMSVENFCTVMKSSISYLTMLTSMQ